MSVLETSAWKRLAGRMSSFPSLAGLASRLLALQTAVDTPYDWLPGELKALVARLGSRGPRVELVFSVFDWKKTVVWPPSTEVRGKHELTVHARVSLDGLSGMRIWDGRVASDRVRLTKSYVSGMLFWIHAVLQAKVIQAFPDTTVFDHARVVDYPYWGGPWIRVQVTSYLRRDQRIDRGVLTEWLPGAVRATLAEYHARKGPRSEKERRDAYAPRAALPPAETVVSNFDDLPEHWEEVALAPGRCVVQVKTATTLSDWKHLLATLSDGTGPLLPPSPAQPPPDPGAAAQAPSAF